MTPSGTICEPPRFLNTEFLSKALREGLALPSLQINSCRITPATAVGDNYCSLMFRIAMEVVKTPSAKPEMLSVVCKTLPRGEGLQDLGTDLFEKEANILKFIMPGINGILKDTLPDEEKLCAECIWYGKEPEEVLILEDLKESGFGLVDRWIGLDENVTNLVLEGLAKMHAGSLALFAKQPDKKASLPPNYWVNTKTDHVRHMIESGLNGLVEAASEWDNFPNEYLQKLKNLKGKIFETMCGALAFDDNAVNVLQHADCWTNNIMFSKQQDVVKELRFVDFSMCCLNSAGMDLNYFIFTSPIRAIRVANIDSMLEVYYRKFTDTVQKLGVVLPRKFTLEDLKLDFKRRAFFGFVISIVTYPITVLDPKYVLDINDIFDANFNKKALYEFPVFRETFKLTLPYFVECGVL